MLGQLGNDPWLGTGPAGEPQEEQRVPARVRSVGYNGYLDRLASQQALAAPGDGGDRGAAAAGNFCPAGPAIGAHNDEIMGEVLGLKPAEIESLRQEGVL